MKAVYAVRLREIFYLPSDMCIAIHTFYLVRNVHANHNTLGEKSDMARHRIRNHDLVTYS